MAEQSPCVFCEIAAHRIPADVLFEDRDHLAFFPLEHINPGHLVLIPRAHVDDLFELEAAAYHALWTKAAALQPGLRKVTHAKRIGVAVEGFGVPHVHVHLVPLYAGDELNPARAKALEASERQRLGSALREVFGG